MGPIPLQERLGEPFQMAVRGADLLGQPSGHRHSIGQRRFSESKKESDSSPMGFHGAAVPFVVQPKLGRNANLTGDILHGGSGHFTGMAGEAAQELKAFKQDRQTEPRYP